MQTHTTPFPFRLWRKYVYYFNVSSLYREQPDGYHHCQFKCSRCGLLMMKKQALCYRWDANCNIFPLLATPAFPTPTTP